MTSRRFSMQSAVGAGALTVPVTAPPRDSRFTLILRRSRTRAITGSRVTIEGEPVVIANEVKEGDAIWTLPDAAGLPLWRGRGKQQ